MKQSSRPGGAAAWGMEGGLLGEFEGGGGGAAYGDDVEARGERAEVNGARCTVGGEDF